MQSAVFSNAHELSIGIPRFFLFIPKTTWSTVHGVQDVRLFNNKQSPPQQFIFNGLPMNIFFKYCIFIFLFHFLKNR